MSHRWKFSVAAVLASSATVALADQRVGDTYVVPYGGYVWLDSDRAAKDDALLGIAIGHHLNDVLSLELGLNEGEYDYPNSRDLDLRGYSLDALAVFTREGPVSPYFTIGGGILRTDFGAGDIDSHVLAQAGLGMFLNIAERADGSMRFALRPEVKARWAFPNDSDPQDKYLDTIATLGFQFAFGDARPAPEPVAAEPPPPPPPPPPPEPPKDSDGDGVLDPADKCPGTPRGVAVDVDGCPRKGSVTLQGVTFENNEATLTAESRPVLDELAADLKQHARMKIEVQGHTDSVGADAYNLQLSQDRAASVREYLIMRGVGAEQLVAKGYGETQPLSDNKTAEGRAQNRRVVMNVLENPGDVEVQVEPPKP